MTRINIGTEIDLPDLLTSRMLIQANSGGGKSVTARVLMEEAAGIVPFIVMDVDGEYYTLKEKFGDVLVIGGQYADVPISLKSVKLLPKEIIGSRLSVVLDLSDLKMTERILYAKYFLETMMDLPKQYWVNYLVFIEEAHKLCGEQDKQESATAVKDLMSRGRKMGYCGILITQRISKLHKDAAAECNNKFVGRTFLDIDMDRSARELGFSSQKDKLLLRDLKPGHFYAFGTAITPHHVHEVTINQPKTKIPKAGSSLEIKPQKPTDKIKSVLAKLADLPGEAEKEMKTMKELQLEVSRLRSELSKAAKQQPVDQVWVKELKQEIVNRERKISEKDYEIAGLRTALDTYDKRNSDIAEVLCQLADRMEDSHTAPEKKLPDIAKKFPKTSQSFQKSETIVQKTSIPARNVNTSSSEKLAKCPLAILQFLASFPDRQFSKAQAGIATGYSPGSGGFNNSLSELTTKGLISRADGKLQASDIDLSPWIGDHQPQHYSIDTFKDKLGKCEREIYQVLLDNPRDQFTKEQLADLTESKYSHSSGGFNNSLSTLTTLELIKRDRGLIQLNPELLEI